MPGTTPNGLPYPLASEPVKDGAVAIQNLAAALDNRGYGLRVEAKRVQVTTNASGVAVVTFAKAFPSPPVIATVAGTGDVGGFFLIACLYDPQNDTGQRFSVGLRNVNPSGPFAGTCYIHYVAIGTYS